MREHRLRPAALDLQSIFPTLPDTVIVRGKVRASFTAHFTQLRSCIMASKKDTEKKVDLATKGNHNPDPITNAPGSHPIETGVGARW
jgi:hypothetical protein